MSASKTKLTTLSAVQPTNGLQLGNLLGALKNWVAMQDQYQCIYFAVDQHAITERQNPEQFRQQTYYAIATYLAAGIDPTKSIVFVQSHVHEHTELAWILTCHAYMGELSRMTQFKDKSAKHGQNIPVGIFSYPILMAADILLYDTGLVPVGADQKQHIELTRDIAGRMNNLYGEIFKMPEPLISKVGARIMSLQDPTAKMSKSDPTPGASVFLNDSDKEIEKKLKRAVTDSGSEIAFDRDNKPGVSNLLEIQSAITGKTVETLVAEYAGKQYGHLKVETAEIVINAVRPIRTETERLMADKTHLDLVLKQGAEKARAIAQKTMNRVSDKIGFLPKI
jgi:tryptophanyl-tRNA synthetase